MKILICPDKFKGSLTAQEAAQAIRHGFSTIFPKATFKTIPISDGGEGFTQILTTFLSGKIISVPTTNAVGKPIRAYYGWLPALKTAIIELATVAGLASLPPQQRNPCNTTTAGMASLILHALSKGAKSLWIGLGGSATNDGGTGIAQALGWKLLDAKGKPLPLGGAALTRLKTIVPPTTSTLVNKSGEPVSIITACDVRNPLIGPSGCSKTFAPQKGASPKDVALLEKAIMRFAQCTSPSLAKKTGMGAAGGTAFGLHYFFKAKLCSGFQLMNRTCKLSQLIQETDLIITGEGCFDSQSFQGKAVGEILQLCQKFDKPVLVLAGSLQPSEIGLPKIPALSILTAPKQAKKGLYHSAIRAALLLKTGQTIKNPVVRPQGITS